MNKEILEYFKKRWLLPVCVIGFFILSVYMLGFWPKSPIPAFMQKAKHASELKKDLAAKEKELQQIIADNKAKQEAAKNATVKEFYISDSGDLSPLLENVTTFIKQDGLRLKSININSSPNDTLIKNGMGAYNGNRVDFELVGYYPQYVTLLNDLNNYQYFIALSKFDIKPYQYDKKILIANLSVTLYSKR